MDTMTCEKCNLKYKTDNSCDTICPDCHSQICTLCYEEDWKYMIDAQNGRDRDDQDGHNLKTIMKLCLDCRDEYRCSIMDEHRHF